MDTRNGVDSSVSCLLCPPTWHGQVPLLLPVVHVNNKSKVLSCLCAPPRPCPARSASCPCSFSKNGQTYYMRHHLQPQQFLPAPQARRRCLHRCVRVSAAAIIMSNILLDAAAASAAARISLAAASTEPELPQSLANALSAQSCHQIVCQHVENPLARRKHKQKCASKRIFQFDFHLHLEFFLHENYFRLAVIYRPAAASSQRHLPHLLTQRLCKVCLNLLTNWPGYCLSNCVCVCVWAA